VQLQKKTVKEPRPIKRKIFRIKSRCLSPAEQDGEISDKIEEKHDNTDLTPFDVYCCSMQ
jgi:hypothetical protein